MFRDAPRPCRSPWLHLLPFASPSASLPSGAARGSPRPDRRAEPVRGGPTPALEPWPGCEKSEGSVHITVIMGCLCTEAAD